MPSEHSTWSPSAAHRYMRCAASHQAEQGFPNTSSVYADEGTAAHELAANILGAGFPYRENALGQIIKAGGREFKVTSEMLGYVLDYTDDVLAEVEPGDELLVEVKVNFSRFVGVPEAEGWGTSDAVVLKFDKKVIQVHDLKYGFRPVSAVENEQGMLYALGALAEFDYMADFETVEIFIHQPRTYNEAHPGPSRWSISVEDLMFFAFKVESAVLAAKQPNPPFTPGEKQCQWCRAASACPAKREQVFGSLVQTPADIEAFEDLTSGAARVLSAKITEAKALSDQQLVTAFKMTPLIENWITAVRAELDRRMLAEGREIPGVKVVQGKQGNRAWKDEEAAVKLMQITVPEALIYDRKVISPTTAEKSLKKAHPATWGALQSYIIRSPGRPSVALDGDPRPAAPISASADDFEDLSSTRALPAPDAHPFRS